MLTRVNREQSGITGLETAIILIAFVVVASVFAYTVLSAGLFATDKGREAIYSSLDEIQGTMEIRGSVFGYRDTLNSGGKGSLGKVEITVSLFSDKSQVDLTSAYSIDPGSGALSKTNPDANRLQVSFFDKEVNLPDCPWTVNWIGQNNGDYILDSGEKAAITVWLHDFDGTTWSNGNSPPFLGTHYVETYHTFNLEIKSPKGPTLAIERTTPAHLDPVNNLR